MAGRRILNEQDARRCLGAAEKSGDGLAAWARAHSIDGRSLNLWRLNLERRTAPRVAVVKPRLVELVPSPAPNRVRAPFKLNVGGVTLDVTEDFDEQAPRRLVGLLKSC